MTEKQTDTLEADFLSAGLLPAKIRQLRLEHHYTQRFVAEHLNISPQAYGYYERGQRKLTSSMMAILSALYHINIMELMELELTDSNPELMNSLVRDAAPASGSSLRCPPKPGYVYEQLTLQEYQLVNYYRKLPASVKSDISFMVAPRNRRGSGKKDNIF
ncbi:MAG: helix-turn-helix transcriptional regulator [Lachnospiraceae bacterium]|nr:helix-turn-helix transcriptional regulator [Lachnospiraceae bacterium]